MRSATRDSSTKLSDLIRDPFVRVAFRRAEEDGDGAFALDDHPPSLTDGAAERLAFGTRRVFEEA